MPRLIRILVLSLVTLCGLAFSTSPAVPPDKAPANPAVTANNDFATHLYQQLAKENAGKSLFFSPFSMSVGLAMTAEGARNETALQMGKALQFPPSVQGAGDEAKETPWNTALMHAGLADLLNRFTPKPVAKEVTDKIARLRKELEEANARVTQLMKSGKESEAFTASTKSRKLADDLNKLLDQTYQYELRVANALWAEKSYLFQPSYLETVHKYYRTGGAFPVDFQHQAEAGRKRINAWVEEQTHNRIKDLLPPRILDENTRLVLTNAIYFKGVWAEPFEPRSTKDEDFRLLDKKKVRVPMMNDTMGSAHYGAFHGDGNFFKTPQVSTGRKGEEFYPDRKGFAVLEMPYKGEELSMVVLLPRAEDGLSSLEKLLTGANLQTWVGKLEKRTVEVSLPRFKLETDYPMKPVLKGLGMIRAFTEPRKPDGAQFDGMSVSKDPAKKLFIADVLHKAFVEVTEKGTEAAAATAVIITGPESAPLTTRPFTPTFRADRPFMFLIRDRKTGAILFLGRMLNPKG